jgi:uncharacterized protein (DUF342 family)
LVISEDRLKAYLRVEGQQKTALNIGDIKKFLKEKGIRHGLAQDSVIDEYVKSGAFWEGPCRLAQGTAPAPGKDAQVTYCFDKDPLRIGIIKAGGGIDFRDKGEIPQVKEGALLGEKVPLVKEKPGKDVYGEPIAVEKAKDFPLIPGPGAKASADRLKLFARRSGQPMVGSDGKVSVFNELRISGDVGLKTGHVRFDGFVDVTGAIQAGFQVKAGRLAVKEILRAEVESDGDVVVDGGIIGAKVVCRGNLKTRFIQSSRVEAWGDVIVEREIIDSKVEAHGTVIAQPAGRLVTSRILATKGITATQIGSDSSKPCVLTVGVDSRLQSVVKKLQEEVAAKEGEQKKIKASIEVLNQASYSLQEDIVRFVQIQDRAAGEQRSCQKKMDELKEKNDLPKLAQVQIEMEKLAEKKKSAEEPLQKVMDKEEQFKEKIAALQSQITDSEGVVKDLQSEIARIMEECQKKEIAPIRVLKEIFPGTILEGCHSRLTVKENSYRTLIKETNKGELSPEGNTCSSWEFQFYPLS